MRILVGALAVLTIGLGRFLGMNPPDSAPSETSGRSSKQSEKSNRSGDSLTWLQRIDRLRVEERTVEALSVGWSAYHTVPPSRRPELLRALTLALLTDVPEDQAATALQKRIEADPDDLDARVAVLRRSLTAESAPPNRPRIARSPSPNIKALVELSEIVEQAPEHLGARESLINGLLDEGRIDEARTIWHAWPDQKQDDWRRLRLQARFDLDFDGRPDRAAEALEALLALTPHDWHLRARLSRALEMQGRSEEARHQAQLVDALRERLDPDRLGRRLASDFERRDDRESFRDLADLCSSIGLWDLAAAWRREAETVRSSADFPTKGTTSEVLLYDPNIDTEW